MDLYLFIRYLVDRCRLYIAVFCVGKGGDIMYIYFIKRGTYAAALAHTSCYSVDFGQDVVDFNLKYSTRLV